jgi:hypothetical protein
LQTVSYTMRSSPAFPAILTLPSLWQKVWSAKYTFVLGLVWIGSFSLGLGFVKDPYAPPIASLW